MQTRHAFVRTEEEQNQRGQYPNASLSLLVTRMLSLKAGAGLKARNQTGWRTFSPHVRCMGVRVTGRRPC